MTPRVPAAPVTFPVANALVMVPLLRPAKSPGSAIDPHADRAARARLAGGAELGQVSSRGARDRARVLSRKAAHQAERATADIARRRRACDRILVAGDKTAGGAAVARLHISERDGGLDGTGIAADETAGLQVRNVGPSHIAARKRVGNHALTGATPTLICANEAT